MVSRDRINRILEGYDKDKLVIATACSHTSLQIFDGARKEGFRTMGIAVGQKTKFYDAFPRGKPDEFFHIDSYTQLLNRTEELIEKNVIIVPHGSFVEYMTPKNFEDLEVPKEALIWQDPIPTRDHELIDARDIAKIYETTHGPVEALRGVEAL